MLSLLLFQQHASTCFLLYRHLLLPQNQELRAPQRYGRLTIQVLLLVFVLVLDGKGFTLPLACETVGTYEITSSNWKEYSFPIAFPNACYGVVTTPVPNAGTASSASLVPATIASYTKTSFTAALYSTMADWRFVAFALGE